MTDLQLAKDNLKDHSVSFAKGKTAFVLDGKGIAPLLSIVGEKRDLSGFAVCDKIVGKAAAMLFVKMGVKIVFGIVMSKSAKAFLEDNGIECKFDTLADAIINHAGTGSCPMEEVVANLFDVDEAHAALVKRLEKMRK